MINKLNLKKIKIFKKEPIIAVFIDAGNLWGVYNSTGKMLDLRKLKEFFASEFNGSIFRVFLLCSISSTWYETERKYK